VEGAERGGIRTLHCYAWRQFAVGFHCWQHR